MRLNNFNPRSPRGGATLYIQSVRNVSVISIHAPREGERPQFHVLVLKKTAISIHAPREGERLRRKSSNVFGCHFNPRSPRGGATSSNVLRENNI